MLLMPQSDAFQSGPGVLLIAFGSKPSNGLPVPAGRHVAPPTLGEQAPALTAPLGCRARAEALAEAIYLLRCPSALGDLAGFGRQQVLLVALSEPSRSGIPWPFQDECRQVRRRARPCGGLRAQCGAAQGPPHHPAAARACHRPARSRAAKHGAWAGMQRQHGREPHLTEAERVWGQGVAGFEDLLKALERHGGALSVLTWRRSGMQTHQANRFIAMFAVAQARAQRAQRAHPARRPALPGHTVSHAAAVGRHLSSDGATCSAILPLSQPSTVRPCIGMH